VSKALVGSKSRGSEASFATARGGSVGRKSAAGCCTIAGVNSLVDTVVSSHHPDDEN
jgi:hypothetical protein